MRKVDKIKKHFVENKKLYLGISIGVVVTSLVTSKAYQINYKSEGATNVFVEAPKRKIHPGYVVRDNETGMVYPSLRSASNSTNVRRTAIPNSDRFDILGEAVA